MGLDIPRSTLGAVLLLIFYRILVQIVGLRITERDPEEVPREERVRIDTLGALGSLAGIDLILGQCMQVKQLLVAIQRGHRMQVLQGLCAEITRHGITGGPVSKRETMVIAAAQQLTSRTGTEGECQLQQALGIALYMRGHYRESLQKLDFVARVANGGWAAANARLFGCLASHFSGRYREAARRAPRLLRYVEERGDLYTEVSLRATIMTGNAMTADDPDEARRQVHEAMSRWTRSAFHIQHWYAMWWEASLDLYIGDGARARARLERDARALRRSLLLNAGLIWGLTTYLKGCCAVASIEAAPSERKERVAEARRIARSFGNSTSGWRATYAAVVHAVADNAAGDTASAAARLREAIRHAEASDLAPQAWSAQYQLGKMIGGDAGRELAAKAEGSMRDEGVRSPERTAGWLVPGRWGA
jgi:hypothetical protein